MSIIDTELLAGSVIRSRVRLARNVEGYPFKIDNFEDAREIIKKVNRALIKCGTFNLYYGAKLSELKLEALKERHLISTAFLENLEFSAALINEDESLSVMVHEEDVLREQCFMKGLCLSEAYKRIERTDEELSKHLNFAFDKNLGYLTACPTNLGTGLRASVMMFLPALTESGKIQALYDQVSKQGLTIRGVYGEGSRAEGFMYQISNEYTLGVSEQEIINSIQELAEDVCRAERIEMERVYGGRKELKTTDRARKSYGLLTNSVLLSYSEFLEHVSNVKLGAMLGLIDIQEVQEIDDLIVKVRPANLCEQYGRRLSAQDRDLVRAQVVGQKLQKLKE